ncbi:hypothetical protein [Mycolicibacterium sp. F2034L]|uniref:hypothetical protein n=1 Tax=Mycolicibacterium sp. F2034L TaxID=2926422 RepID=UPI001FF22D6A|nr:hypothetical protein [Mycolicibacterium sp. F2034L]
MDIRTASGAATPNRDATGAAAVDRQGTGTSVPVDPTGVRDNPGAAESAAMPSATSGREEIETLQDSGTQFLGGGGAGTLPVATAGFRDGVGAAGKLLVEVAKQALGSRPLMNSLQGLGPKIPGLIDLIPKTRYTVPEDPLRRAVRESQEAEAKREQDAKGRRINEIMEKGVKLTASDGSPVYTVDGETFVKYASNGGIAYGDKYTPNPPTPRLVTIRQGPNADRSIRSILKVDPAQVRNLSGQRTPGPVPISTPFSAPIVAWKYQPPVYILVGGGTGGFGRSPF